MKNKNHLPTLFVALCTVLLGGCALEASPPVVGSSQRALEAHELPEDLCSCADLYGTSRSWLAPDSIYQVTSAPDLLVFAMDGELDCYATWSELLQRPDLAPLARLRPLVGGGSRDPAAHGTQKALSDPTGRESVSAGERGDSNPLPAAPLPDESAEDSNPLPAKQGMDPNWVPSPVDDSNPLPARDSHRRGAKLEQYGLPTPLN